MSTRLLKRQLLIPLFIVLYVDDVCSQAPPTKPTDGSLRFLKAALKAVERQQSIGESFEDPGDKVAWDSLLRVGISYESHFDNIGGVFGNEVVFASPYGKEAQNAFANGPKLLFVQDNPSRFPLRVEEVIAKLREFGYTNRVAVANILGQIEAESNFDPTAVEGKYSGKTLFRLWGPDQDKNTILFKSLEEADELVKSGTEAVYNRIYGHAKNKLGNTRPGDGFRFRGRGYLQLTGRSNYEAIGRVLLRETGGGIDLMADPNLASRPEVATEIVPLYLRNKGIFPNNLGILEDVELLTKAIGPADNSLEKRRAAADRFYQFLSLRISPGDVVLFRREKKNLPLIWCSNTVGHVEAGQKATDKKLKMSVSLFFSDNFAGKRPKATELFSPVTEINTMPPRFTPLMLEKNLGGEGLKNYEILKWKNPYATYPKSPNFLSTNIGSKDEMVPVYKGYYLRVFNLELERFTLLRRR